MTAWQIPSLQWCRKLGSSGCERTVKSFDVLKISLEVIPKQIFMILAGENLQAKVAQTLFGQIRKNSGKNPSHPQKFACSLHLCHFALCS